MRDAEKEGAAAAAVGAAAVAAGFAALCDSLDSLVAHFRLGLFAGHPS